MENAKYAEFPFVNNSAYFANSLLKCFGSRERSHETLDALPGGAG